MAFRCVDACHGKYNLGVSPKCGFDSSLGALAGLLLLLLLHRIWSVDWGLTVAQYWKKKEKGIVWVSPKFPRSPSWRDFEVLPVEEK